MPNPYNPNDNNFFTDMGTPNYPLNFNFSGTNNTGFNSAFKGYNNLGTFNLAPANAASGYGLNSSSFTPNLGLNNPLGSDQSLWDKLGAFFGKDGKDGSGWTGEGLIKNGLDGIGMVMGYLNGKKAYQMGQDYLNLARNNMLYEQKMTTDSYNNTLKQYNARLADRLRARAAFEQGNTHAYDDEIAANQMTSSPNPSDLSYKRSANA